MAQQERIVTRTVSNAQLTTVRQLGLIHEIAEFTTLNQALNEPGITPMLPSPLTLGMEITDDYDAVKDTQNLYTKYLVLGNGGHKQINNPEDVVPYTVPVPHLATDTGLYNTMPILARPVNDDLTPVERRQYCLRRTIMKDKILYAFYFGRVLEYDRTTPDSNITHVENGEETTEEFVATMNNLKPSHPDETNTYEGSYASVSAHIRIVWTKKDIEEMQNACAILFGNPRVAIISEMAVCSAVLKPVTKRYPPSGPQNPVNTPVNTFYEAVGCQVQVFISTHAPVGSNGAEYALTLDLGATEPLFGVNVSL